MSNFDPTNNYSGVNGYGSGYDPYNPGAVGSDDPMGGANGSYGDLYGTSNYGGSNPLDLYNQYRAMAYQSLQNPYLSQAQRQAWSTYLNELNGWFQQYGGQTSGWDPLSGNTDTQLSFPVSYQDQTRIVTDEGSDFYLEVNRTDTETRTIESYQQDGTIVIPSNSATTNISEATDARGKKMKVVQVTYEDGTTRSVHFYGENLTIKAANPVNVIQDVSVTGGVSIEGLGEESFLPESSVQGDKQADGSLLYDSHDPIDFTPKGSGKDGQVQVHDVYAPANIIVPNTSTYEVEPVVEYHYDSTQQRDVIDSTKYKITVNHKDGSKDVFLSEGFPMNIEARDGSGTFYDTIYDDGGQIHEIREKVEYDDKGFPGITLNNPDGPTGKSASHTADGQPLSGRPEDMAPTSFSDNGETAFYDTYDMGPARVDLHANFDDEVHTHDISATGPVHIHGTGSADTMKITSYDPATHTWTIEIYKNGDTNNKETVIIHGGPSTQVILDVTDPSRVVESDELKSSVQIGEGEPQNTNNAKADGIAEKLSNATGMDKALITQEAEKAGFSLDAPPAVPTPELLAFLINIDPTLKQWLSDWRNTSDIGLKNQITSEVRDEVVRLLKKIYPSTFNISAQADSADGIQFGTDGNEGTYNITIGPPTGFGDTYASALETSIYFFGDEGSTPPITGTAAYHHDGGGGY